MVESDKHGPPLYGALTGVLLPGTPVELVPGVSLSRAYFHVFSHPMLAFAEGELGAHTPGPWVAVESEANSRRAHVELAITDTAALGNLSPSDIAWFVAALLRLRAESPVRVLVVSKLPREELRAATTPWVQIFEPAGHQTGYFRQSLTQLTAEDIAWLSKALATMARLWTDLRFMRAFTIFDQSLWMGRPEIGKVFIWTALEILFDISGEQHKTKAMCNALAGHVGVDKQDRDRAYNVVRDLYEKRGRVIHSGKAVEDHDYAQTFMLARYAFIKVLDNGELPPDSAAQS